METTNEPKQVWIDDNQGKHKTKEDAIEANIKIRKEGVFLKAFEYLFPECSIDNPQMWIIQHFVQDNQAKLLKFLLEQKEKK